MMSHRYTCPCCGFQTLGAPPGSFEICRVCFWEDDAVQLLDPWFAGGANRSNLVEAQASYATCGAVEERFLQYVKDALPTDVRDAAWRRVAVYDRAFVRRPRDLSADEHSDLNVWYYWRKSIS
jgi:hypothetical protein